MDDMDRLFYRQSIAPPVTPTVKRLIVITSLVFVAQVIVHLAKAPFEPERWLGLSPMMLKQLCFWQPLTYVFLHSVRVTGIFHILFNMLFLYWFGRDVETKLGSRRFLFFYLSAGALAGLAFSLVHWFWKPNATVIGASGAVIGVMVLYAVHFPDRILLAFFFFPMRVRTFVLMSLGLDLWFALTAADYDVAVLAHLAGAAYGWAFARLSPAHDRWMEAREAAREAMELREREDDERFLDELLEKVRVQGVHSLSRRERQFLMKMSRKMSRT